MTSVAPGTVEVSHLSKSFGAVHAVQDLSFTVEPGSVTGFLGPNGAGKTTTLRMLLGLVSPSGGTATIGGRPYADLEHPARTVGASLEASSFHPGRSAAAHLRVLCLAAGLPAERADASLAQVGLTDAADRRVGQFSLGMRQRLALAAALLGDPQVLLLDEPANGLDPEGIAWLRGFLRHLAGTGRTVLVSSHVLSEVEQTVDNVVILARGRLVRAGTLPELVGSSAGHVLVRSPDAARLTQALAAAGGSVTGVSATQLSVAGLPIEAVGHAALQAGVELHELRTESTDLEEVFLSLTQDPAGSPGGPAPEAAP